MYGLLKQDGEGSLLDVSEKDAKELRRILKPFYEFYDWDRSGSLSRVEFGKVMADLREYLPPDEESRLFNQADIDSSGNVEFEEFVLLMAKYLDGQLWTAKESRKITPRGAKTKLTVMDDDEDSDEEEEDEIPEDLRDMSPEEQQRAIKCRAF